MLMDRRSEGLGHCTLTSLHKGRTIISQLTYITMNNHIREARAAIIAELNDAFRETGQGGKVCFTSGVWEQGTAFVTEAINGVQNFKDFTPENDPYGEHDFGS